MGVVLLVIHICTMQEVLREYATVAFIDFNKGDTEVSWWLGASAVDFGCVRSFHVVRIGLLHCSLWHIQTIRYM